MAIGGGTYPSPLTTSSFASWLRMLLAPAEHRVNDQARFVVCYRMGLPSLQILWCLGVDALEAFKDLAEKAISLCGV